LFLTGPRTVLPLCWTRPALKRVFGLLGSPRKSLVEPGLQGLVTDHP
jgi:hypothetical protein